MNKAHITTIAKDKETTDVTYSMASSMYWKKKVLSEYDVEKIDYKALLIVLNGIKAQALIIQFFSRNPSVEGGNRVLTGNGKLRRKPISPVGTRRIGNNNVKFKNSVRYFGMYFDKEMGLRIHCYYLKDKVGFSQGYGELLVSKE
uniref:Uncharacterized protein n=1 Tax=Vespula pensylvanica TaxID=30213 RepID=A0A834UAE4_VESPE|nr:hypothetical protein H0235_008317 [Vespula pensylvanica]